VTLQFGASLTDDTRSVNYDRNTFIIQATDFVVASVRLGQTHLTLAHYGIHELRNSNVIIVQAPD